MSNENYKLFRKHQLEIFDMFYDIFDRAPFPDDLDWFFGTETKAKRKEFNKKMQEFIKTEEPKIKERFKEMGFDFKR